MIFSIGDDIVLTFEITEMLGHDYVVQCFSIHAPNNTLARGLLFTDRGQYGVEMSDEVGGINATIEEDDLGGLRSSRIEITISNATEKHVGLYSCTYSVRLTDWGGYPSSFWATTGTKLSLSHDTEWPTRISYEMGNNLLGDGEIDDEAMMEEGFPNVFKCSVTAWQFPSNISLSFQDENLPLYGPIAIGWPSYNSVEYAYRFAEVTAADAGTYKWVVEIGNQVIEKEIAVGIATA